MPGCCYGAVTNAANSIFYYTVTQENTGNSGDYVGLAGIARKLGLSNPEALDSAETNAAPKGWAGWLGAAKIIANANGMTWDGPPVWQTWPVLEVGDQVMIPQKSSGPVATGKSSGSALWWLLGGAAAIAIFSKGRKH